MEKKGKITWVIGDIHGMYDPLRALIDHLDNEVLDKFIFVGDYIDHGPSSKEVLDLVMDLGDKAVPLMGNHEYLLLQTLYDEYHRERFGYRIWKENGAESTIRSFKYKNFEEFEAKIDKKYTEFLKKLACFHVETVPCGDTEINFLITHAGVVPSIPVEEQLAANSYLDFNKFIEEKRLWIENTSIWIRDDFFRGDYNAWKDYIIIHGHTPTHLLNYFALDLPSDYSGETPYLRRSPESDQIVSIDIDTGAAFGKRLTAFGFPSEGEDEYRELFVKTAQVYIEDGYYRRRLVHYDSFLIEL